MSYNCGNSRDADSACQNSHRYGAFATLLAGFWHRFCTFACYNAQEAPTNNGLLVCEFDPIEKGEKYDE
jgi:hypothetical protein